MNLHANKFPKLHKAAWADVVGEEQRTGHLPIPFFAIFAAFCSKTTEMDPKYRHERATHLSDTDQK